MVAVNLSKEVCRLALDTLTGGWFRYGHLSDGVQIRCTWHTEGSDTWLQVENLETGHMAHFTLDVTVQPYTAPPIGPEDDGALREEIAMGVVIDPYGPDPTIGWDPDRPGCAPEECGGSRLDPCVTVMKTRGKAHDGEVTDHPFTVGEGATGTVCTAMVMRDGGGDSCGLPASAHLPDHRWAAREAMKNIPTECANCAPLAAGASIARVDGTREEDPCEDCRLTYPWTWAEVRAGDEVQGEDGAWYPVCESKPSSLFNGTNPIQVVTLEIGGVMRAYDMPYRGPVRIKLGEEHRAVRNLKAGFPGTEEVR